MQFTARDISQWVGGRLHGDPDQLVTGVAGIKEAQPGDCTFVGSPKYLSAIKTSRAAVVLIDPKMPLDGGIAAAFVQVDNPSLAFAKVVEHFRPPPIQYAPGIHPTAVITPTASLGKDVGIHAQTVIEDGVVIGDRTIIGAGCYIGHQTRIGDDCLIHARVVVREYSRIGHRVILQNGAVIGADGFGYNTINGEHQKIPQVGVVELGDDVEIGANTTIDRARFGTTRVGKGTKIDNLVQIGHNCVIGEHCIICGQVGLAGTTVVGNHVTIAGQVGVAGHLTIGDNSVIMAQAGVTKDVPPGSLMLGAPAVPHTEFKRLTAALHRLPETTARLRGLEQQVANLRERPPG